MERRNAWLSYTEAEEKELEKVAKEYRNFLDAGKTERECVTQIIKEAQEAGYECLEEKAAKGEKLKAGDKVYTVGMKKIIALFHIGQDDIAEGMNILGAHIDSPRLDIKQNPLYEDTDFAYLDTHYYGGVKKYQWVTIPLAIHGVVAKKDGSVVQVNIGEDENDPIVYITDLLIHLAGKQLQKTASEVIEGENLDILIGSRPLKDLEDDKKKEAVKQNVLNILKDKYDIEDEEILMAIRSHTTGRPGMSLLEKIVYIADYMEPGRKELPNMMDVRHLAFEDIDKCLYRILRDSLVYLKAQDMPIDQTTEETYQYYNELYSKH